MLSFKPLVRKVLSTALFASLTLSAVGFVHTGNAAAASSAQAYGILATGQQFLGVKYQFGATSGITSAFDCSSFTQYIYKQIGITLPRTSSLQAEVGIPVAKNDLEIGDLVFFKDPSRPGRIGHVGIYTGDDKMLNTGGKDGVKFSSLNSSYYKKYYVTARRVV